MSSFVVPPSGGFVVQGPLPEACARRLMLGGLCSVVGQGATTYAYATIGNVSGGGLEVCGLQSAVCSLRSPSPLSPLSSLLSHPRFHPHESKKKGASEEAPFHHTNEERRLTPAPSGGGVKRPAWPHPARTTPSSPASGRMRHDPHAEIYIMEMICSRSHLC